MKNYYKILGIEKIASEVEIKKAYASMVRKFPPEKAGEKFGEISEAYSMLSNKKKRIEYDKENGFDDVSQELFDTAKDCIDKKEYTTSIKKLKKFILLNPENIASKHYLSLCQYKIEDFHGVYDNTKYIIDNDEEVEESYFDNFIIAAIKLNRFVEAEYYLLKAIDKFDSIHFYMEMCSLYSNKDFKKHSQIKEILEEKINPRLENESLNYEKYNELAIYASIIKEEKLIELYLKKFVENVKVSEFDKALEILEDNADATILMVDIKTLEFYMEAIEELIKRFISLREENEKKIRKIKSLKRIFNTIKPIVMNPEICYEVKSYIINVLRIDLLSNKEKVKKLSEENINLIKAMSEMAVKEPEILRESIVKIKKNDLVYLKVMDVFNKYYKLTSPKVSEEIENSKEEEEIEEIEKETIEAQEFKEVDEQGIFEKIRNIFVNKGR